MKRLIKFVEKAAKIEGVWVENREWRVEDTTKCYNGVKKYFAFKTKWRASRNEEKKLKTVLNLIDRNKDHFATDNNILDL